MHFGLSIRFHSETVMTRTTDLARYRISSQREIGSCNALYCFVLEAGITEIQDLLHHVASAKRNGATTLRQYRTGYKANTDSIVTFCIE